MTIEQQIVLYDQTAQLLRILSNGGNMADYLAELIQADAVRRGIHIAPPEITCSKTSSDISSTNKSHVAKPRKIWSNKDA